MQFDGTHRVMGIRNLTPDSFVTSSRHLGESESKLLSDIERMIEEGMDILDLGAESTRPGASPTTWEEEWKRLEQPLRSIRRTYPHLMISVDTYHTETAERSIAAGADIINDISGGSEAMYMVIARERVPYILTHAGGEDSTDYLIRRIDRLQRLGAADIIVDPGIGFGKTQEQNWQALRELSKLQILERPILVGLSRKSMLTSATGSDAEHATNATTAANMLALIGGASILRVHDVREAKETIAIYKQYKKEK